MPQEQQQELIPSPFSPTSSSKRITREQFEQIRQILGVKSLLIVCDEAAHDCKSQEECPGHYMYFRSDGFMSGQLEGIAENLFEASKPIAISHKKLDY